MKIQTSSVSMQGAHQSYSYVNSQTKTVDMSADEAAKLSFNEGKSFISQLTDYENSKNAAIEARSQQGAAGMSAMFGQMTVSSKESYTLTREDQMSLLDRLLKALYSSRMKHYRYGNHNQYNYSQQMSFEQSFAGFGSAFSGIHGLGIGYSTSDVNEMSSTLDLTSSGTGAGTLWTRVNAREISWLQKEDTAFSATGVAHTADGRTIEFGVELGMSRQTAGIFQSLSQSDYVLTDPLVINIDTGAASVTDQKFYFDLDADGREEEISFARQGSGFLALDKNGDGIINDGSELFGTKSGDGFADLMAYDEDGNGWIDENDSVFDKLKVWTMDENGKKSLISLQKADVGAIYLGHVGTEFSLKDGYDRTNALIRSTGVYLKESGGVGTVQQVDLAAG